MLCRASSIIRLEEKNAHELNCQTVHCHASYFERIVAHALSQFFDTVCVPIIDRRDRFYLGYYSRHARDQTHPDLPDVARARFQLPNNNCRHSSG